MSTRPPTGDDATADAPAGTDVLVTPEAALRANRENWDDRADIHAGSAMYDLPGFVADPGLISDVTAEDLAILGPHLPGGTVAGLDVVHLQCHVGKDTLSLARLGARVTGMDLSSRSLEIARELARDCGLEARFVEADVQHAADALDDTFDVVYTSIGTVTWLPDLTSWARSIARLLRPGGTFFIRDGHPMLYTLDDERSDLLAVRHRYFPSGLSQTWVDTYSYTGDEQPIEHPRTYEWPHSLAEIIGSLLGAGLRITSMGEQQTVPWPAHPLMEETDGAWAFPEPLRQRVPTTYSITAVKDD
ncbi:Methyltransferase domain-containing protein [Georgenia satyanarayanai]|uniref:Methyltransferase domain-containing protein n=1 Tax=Georgenia satyanarayanai TaxID=860221 RepID=A0A2Y8ZWU0_9MICO|nr:class I SAM-dependent methyltransferase [Georgenia satyanarayanai]PYG01724.1 methyltransferase family protein [Georgenia satyanarayanai]SSA36524.1 Methyltransferase domain-containing protein [Georgenia satyanarayanai]